MRGSGDTKRVYVSVNNDLCVWAALNDAKWISVNPDSGMGSAYVSVTLEPNKGKKPRRGSVSFSGSDGQAASTITFTQNPTVTACNFIVSTERPPFFDYSGGTGSISLKSDNSSCQWTASSSIYWLSITSGTSGKGDGKIYFNVDVNNTTDSRRANINISGKIITVTQDGRPRQQNPQKPKKSK